MERFLVELRGHVYEDGLWFAESYSNLTSSCFLTIMATFDLIARLFGTGLAEPFELQVPVQSPVINIELENLDCDGKRCSKRRKISTCKPVSVGHR